MICAFSPGAGRHQRETACLCGEQGQPRFTQTAFHTRYSAGGKEFKVHLDGFNLLPYLLGEEKKWPRTEFYYFNDDGALVAMRMREWKLVFGEQRAPGNLLIWANPFTNLRVPKLYNLRMDPCERADVTSEQYYLWTSHHIPVINEGVDKAAEFLQTFVACPPSQKPPSFSVDQIIEGVKQRVEKLREQEKQKP